MKQLQRRIRVLTLTRGASTGERLEVARVELAKTSFKHGGRGAHGLRGGGPALGRLSTGTDNHCPPTIPGHRKALPRNRHIRLDGHGKDMGGGNRFRARL